MKKELLTVTICLDGPIAILTVCLDKTKKTFLNVFTAKLYSHKNNIYKIYTSSVFRCFFFCFIEKFKKLIQNSFFFCHINFNEQKFAVKTEQKIAAV